MEGAAMTQLLRVIWSHLRRPDDQGQTLVEYALLLVFIALAIFLALVFLGPIISQIFQDVGDTLQ
jgi:Flp pilus assembly pilin Flp